MEPTRHKLPETGVRIYRLERPLRHPAPGIEILFVLSGRVRVEAENRAYHLTEPDVLLLSRCEVVHITTETFNQGQDCLLLVLRAAPGFLSFTFNGDSPAFECNSTAPASPNCVVLRSLLAEAACYGIAGSGGENGLLFNSALFRLFHELRRDFSIPGKGMNENEEMKRERMITSYIKKNYRYPLTLEELSEKFSLNPQYLSRWFRKKFGITFHAYLNRLRLESSIKDLVLSDATVTAIAYDNGFPNLNSFIKEMKDHTGKTPTEYRKDHRVKEQEIEDAITVEGKEDSGQIREKLRAYLKVDAGVFEDNIFFRKKSIVVEADAHKGTHYERPWEESVNLGFAHDIVKTDFRNQICLLQNEISFRYGRFQGLFGKSARISVWGGQEYNFVQIDRIIDFLYEVKLIPFVELSFKPDMIQGKHGEFVFNNSEEIQNFPLDEYEELVIKFLKHMGNRYGLQEISRWRFEMMMEPSGIRHNFEENDVESYIEQFVRIRKTIKDIAPAALVGGPGFNLTRSEDLDVMIRMLHNLEERGSLPDFFSFYAFSFSPMMAADDNIRNLLLWEKRETVERITWAKKFIQSFYPSIKLFFVTEWNMDFSCRNRLHDSLIKAPFILQNCIDAIGTVDVLCYWIALDISVEYSDSSAILFGGPGLLSRHGIRKPSFFVYHFLSRLGPVLLAKGEGYIITEKSENNYTAIIFNYKYISSQSRIRKDFHELSRNPSEFLEDRENLTVSLRIGNIKSGKYKVKHHILNTQSGSVYDTWKNLSAIDELNSTETAWLERTCIPAIRIDFLDGIGNIAMDCELEPNETRLLEISLILE